MRTLAELLLSNAALATVMALVAAIVGRYCRVPPVVYALWLLVFVKLITPPIFRVPVAMLPGDASGRPTAQELSPQVLEPATVVASQSAAIESGDYDAQLTQSSLPEPHAGTADRWAESTVPQPARSTEQNTGLLPIRPSTSDAVELPSDEAANSRAVADPEPEAAARVSQVASIVWGLGSIVWYLVVLVRVAHFRREARRPWPVDRELQRRADELAQRMGLARAPVVKVVDAVIPPMLWAMCRPAEILLPASLVAGFSSDQRAALLAHELAHYRRRDHWVRWFEIFVIGLYWWHPVVWMARRELHRAEEQCCDAWVLWALPSEGCAYARALLQTIDFLAADRRAAPMLATGLGPVHQLERRIEMILQARPMRRRHAVAQWCLLLLPLLMLPISARGQVAADAGKFAAPATEPQPAVEAQPPAQALPAVEARPSAQARPAVAVGAPYYVPSEPTATPELPRQLGPGDDEPSVQAVSPNDVEKRLLRLEKAVESILAEVRTQRGGNAPRGSASSKMATYNMTPYTSSANTTPAGRAQASSLADLKKQRIDLEEQLENLQERLHEVDDQIAKLQSARSGNRSSGEAKK